jgi:SecD/SecF fusion protein
LRKNRFRIILTLAFLFLSIWFLKPTYDDYQYNKQASQLKTLEDSNAFFDKNANDLLKAKEKRLKLGLDLQGGMYVIMEVDIPKLLQNLAKNTDERFNQSLEEASADVKVTEGDFVETFEAKLKSKGGSIKAYYGEIRDDESKIVSDLKKEVDNAIDRAVEVVRNRIDQYGVSEPVIQKKGASRLVVELPGISNVADVRKLLQGTALLEFKLLIDPDIGFKVMQKIDTYLAGGNLDSLIKADSLQVVHKKDSLSHKDTTKVTEKIKKDSTTFSQKKDTTKKDITKKDVNKKDTSKKNKKDSVKKSDSNEITSTDTNFNQDTTQKQLTEEELKIKNPWFYLVRFDKSSNGGITWYVKETEKPKVLRLLARKDIEDLIPNDMSFSFGNKPVFTDQKTNEKIYEFFVLKREPELTGGVIVNARSNIDQQTNSPVVYMEMNSDGSADWARITGANLNKRIAIVLDNVVYSAPNVRSKITGGNSQIEGIGTVQEAKLLEIVLRAGALPAPLSIIEERTVGPSLGEDSINKGLYSSMFALIVVALFMLVYYHFAGGVADLALLFNMTFVMGIMASFQATLTLPGIAGLILTIGISVDSNVLIYERIREELGSGKPLKTAIEIGYKKAFSAIIDSHVTALITGVILYQFGSGPIQGFALTLIIGLIANLFTAIVITRIIFDIMTDKGKTQINFG